MKDEIKKKVIRQLKESRMLNHYKRQIGKNETWYKGDR